MKKEFSAGGIVFKRSKDQKVKGSNTYWLISQHSQHKGWVFPKGLIGDTIQDESKEDTAVREVKEETGIDAQIIKKIPTPITYYYQFNTARIHKTVYFYLMKHLGGNFENRDREMMDVKWATEQEVKDTLTYNNDKIAFKEAIKLFKKITT